MFKKLEYKAFTLVSETEFEGQQFIGTYSTMSIATMMAEITMTNEGFAPDCAIVYESDGTNIVARTIYKRGYAASNSEPILVTFQVDTYSEKYPYTN